MLNKMIEKASVKVNEIKNWWDNEVMGYRYERRHVYYTRKDGTKVPGHDLILKIDKNDIIRDSVITSWRFGD